MTDWSAWRSHIDQVVADHGQWVGLCDPDGVPVMDLPVSTLDARATMRQAANGELSMPTIGRFGQVHKAVDLLVADDLGAVDEDGELVPRTGPQMMLVVARRGGRSGYMITHPISPVDAFRPPERLTIPSVDLLSSLEFWPAPSVPSSWLPEFDDWTEDAAGPYDVPRVYAPVEFAAAADGYTIGGTAEEPMSAEMVVKTTIQDSLDAVNHMMGWTGDEHMVVDWEPSGLPSPPALVRVDDRPLLDTVQDVAANAGINISVDLWWPGDGAVLVRDADREGAALTVWDRPIGVVRVRKSESVNK